jgi:hypothetical protein
MKRRDMPTALSKRERGGEREREEEEAIKEMYVLCSSRR